MSQVSLAEPLSRIIRLRSSLFTLQETAWVMIACLRAGGAVRARGRCLGSLRAVDLVIRRQTLFRVRPNSALATRRGRAVQQRHGRRGHDEGCVWLGWSLSSAEGLARELCASQAGVLVMDVLRDAIETHAPRARSGNRSAICARITEHAIEECTLRFDPRVPSDGAVGKGARRMTGV